MRKGESSFMDLTIPFPALFSIVEGAIIEYLGPIVGEELVLFYVATLVDGRFEDQAATGDLRRQEKVSINLHTRKTKTREIIEILNKSYTKIWDLKMACP